jgi:hypothetical protein
MSIRVPNCRHREHNTDIWGAGYGGQMAAREKGPYLARTHIPETSNISAIQVEGTLSTVGEGRMSRKIGRCRQGIGRRPAAKS